MGIGDGVEFAGNIGKQVGKFLRHNHTAAGAHAQHHGCLFQKRDCLLYPGVIQQLQGLADGFRGQAADLLGTGAGGVRGMGGSRPGAGAGAVPCQLDFEGVEARQLQAPAEPGDGSLGGAAFLRQLGDGHELDLGILSQHIVGDFPFGGGELKIGGMDMLQNITALIFHNGLLYGWE